MPPGSKKFEQIYPEGEFENFFVCNYGVGGNVPGEPVYQTDCEDEQDGQDQGQEDAITDINDKLEEILQDSKPEQRKILQICLDALICLHEKKDSCPEAEDKCIVSINDQSGDGELIRPENFLANPVENRIEILQCTTDALLCSLKNDSNCQSQLDVCFGLTNLVTSPTTSTTTTTTTTEATTSTAAGPPVTITTVQQPVTIVRQSSDAESTTVVVGSTSIDVTVTTATFNNFDIEITTLKPTDAQNENQRKEEPMTSPASTSTATTSTPPPSRTTLPSSSDSDDFASRTIAPPTESMSKVIASVRDFEQVSDSSPPEQNSLVRTCLNALLCLTTSVDQEFCSTSENLCLERLNEDKEVIKKETYEGSTAGERLLQLQCHTDAKICDLKNEDNCQTSLNDCLTTSGDILLPLDDQGDLGILAGIAAPADSTTTTTSTTTSIASSSTAQSSKPSDSALPAKPATETDPRPTESPVEPIDVTESPETTAIQSSEAAPRDDVSGPEVTEVDQPSVGPEAGEKDEEGQALEPTTPKVLTAPELDKELSSSSAAPEDDQQKTKAQDSPVTESRPASAANEPEATTPPPITSSSTTTILNSAASSANSGTTTVDKISGSGSDESSSLQPDPLSEGQVDQSQDDGDQLGLAEAITTTLKSIFDFGQTSGANEATTQPTAAASATKATATTETATTATTTIAAAEVTTPSSSVTIPVQSKTEEEEPSSKSPEPEAPTSGLSEQRPGDGEEEATISPVTSGTPGPQNESSSEGGTEATSPQSATQDGKSEPGSVFSRTEPTQASSSGSEGQAVIDVTTPGSVIQSSSSGLSGGDPGIEATLAPVSFKDVEDDLNSGSGITSAAPSGAVETEGQEIANEERETTASPAILIAAAGQVEEATRTESPTATSTSTSTIADGPEAFGLAGTKSTTEETRLGGQPSSETASANAGTQSTTAATIDEGIPTDGTTTLGTSEAQPGFGLDRSEAAPAETEDQSAEGKESSETTTRPVIVSTATAQAEDENKIDGTPLTPSSSASSADEELDLGLVTTKAAQLEESEEQLGGGQTSTGKPSLASSGSTPTQSSPAGTSTQSEQTTQGIVLDQQFSDNDQKPEERITELPPATASSTDFEPPANGQQVDEESPAQKPGEGSSTTVRSQADDLTTPEPVAITTGLQTPAFIQEEGETSPAQTRNEDSTTTARPPADGLTSSKPLDTTTQPTDANSVSQKSGEDESLTTVKTVDIVGATTARAVVGETTTIENDKDDNLPASDGLEAAAVANTDDKAAPVLPTVSERSTTVSTPAGATNQLIESTTAKPSEAVSRQEVSTPVTTTVQPSNVKEVAALNGDDSSGKLDVDRTGLLPSTSSDASSAGTAGERETTPEETVTTTTSTTTTEAASNLETSDDSGLNAVGKTNEGAFLEEAGSPRDEPAVATEADKNLLNVGDVSSGGDVVGQSEGQDDEDEPGTGNEDESGLTLEKPDNSFNNEAATTQASASVTETTTLASLNATATSATTTRVIAGEINDQETGGKSGADSRDPVSGSVPFRIGDIEIENVVTTSTTHPVTSVIDFLTTFETPHMGSALGTSIDVSFYNSTAKTSFRLALCLDGVHCKEDSPRCSIIHKECNEGFNVAQLPFQVKKKLSECTVDDILCHLEAKESAVFCKATYEKCANIVIPEAYINTVSLAENPPTEVAVIRPQDEEEEEDDLNPFFTLLALSKMNGGLKESESSFLQNVTKSVLDAVSNTVGGIEILKLNSTEELNDWLKQKDTLPIFHDLTVIIPEEGENATAPANPELIDFDLTNSSIVFDPSSLVIGHTNARDAQILAKNIINSLSDKVHICSSSECGEDEYYGGITGGNGTEVSDDFEDLSEAAKEPDTVGFTGLPKTTTFAEVQIHLANCLDGVACADKRRCDAAQEQCIGKDNAEKFSTKEKKRLCECVVDFYLCSLDNDANKTSCQNNVDSCLTMVIILNGATIPELSTSTQRSFPTTTNPDFTIELVRFQPQSSVSELIENIAKNISMLADSDAAEERKITIQVKNDIPDDSKFNGSIILDKEDETNTITLVSLNPQVQFKPNSSNNEIVIDTSDLVNENASDRQKIAQQRIENVLRQITTDFKFGPSTTESPELQMGITSRINPAITMSASTAFLDEIFNTTESTPKVSSDDATVEVNEKPQEDFIYDLDVTVDSHNLFEVIAAAVTSYESQAASEPKDIIFTIQQTDNKSEPVIMIQMSEFNNSTIVNVKISNDTIKPIIIKVTPEDFMQFDADDNQVIMDGVKLAAILEDKIMSPAAAEPVELSPGDIAEVLSTLVDVNDERSIEILISNQSVKALINNNVFDFKSTETFPKEEKFNLDLSEMPMDPSDFSLNKEVKEIIHQHFIKNLRRLEEGDDSDDDDDVNDISNSNQGVNGTIGSSTSGLPNESQFQLELPTFGISISSQNISANLTQPDAFGSRDEQLQGSSTDDDDDGDEASRPTTSAPTNKSGDQVMLTFPVFGFNISSEGEDKVQPETSASPTSDVIRNEFVEWQGKPK